MTTLKFWAAHLMLARAQRAARKSREFQATADRLFEAIKEAK